MKTIYGYLKGYGYNPTKPFKYAHSTNHAWNAVHVVGQWCLIDCTLGAGTVDEEGHYIREFENFYFLTDPDQLISTHFPYMEKSRKESRPWQLLQKPVTLQAFSKHVNRTITSFKWGVELVSHSEAVIPVTLSVTVFIKGTSRTLYNVLARLTDIDGKILKRYTLVQNPDHNLFSVRVRPPNVGKFRLTVFGSVDQSDKILHEVVSYVLRCRQTEPNVYLYPKHLGIWRSRSDYQQYGFEPGADSPMIISPRDGDLELTIPTRKDFPVTCRVTHSESKIKDIENYILLENAGNFLKIRGHLPEKGFYKLQIFCKSDFGPYEPVLLFLIDCTRGAMFNALPFPVMYSSATEFHCQLIEPLVRELPEESSINIQFRSSDIIKAVVNGRRIEKGNDNIWRSTVRTHTAGGSLRIAGTNELKGRYWVLWEFTIVKGPNSIVLEDILTARSNTSHPPMTQRSDNQSTQRRPKHTSRIKEKTIVIKK